MGEGGLAGVDGHLVGFFGIDTGLSGGRKVGRSGFFWALFLAVISICYVIWNSGGISFFV